MWIFFALNFFNNEPIIIILAIIIEFVWRSLWGGGVQTMIRRKGYNANWFWWGFFFELIALIVALSQPEVGKISLSPAVVAYAKEQRDRADAALLAQNGWKCPRCGKVNPSHTGSCGCGTTRRESELGLAVPEGMDLEFAAAQRIQACKDLLDAGAITQEEFDQKKARLLRLSQNQTSLCGKDKIIMNILEQIKNRSSYRGRYQPTPVPREDLVKIMEAGLAAPSGCNKQTTSLIAVDDPQVLDRLKGVIDPPVASSAPAAICVLTREIAAYRDRCFHVQDYSAAIENMLLAICALGYESCWYEGHITDEDRIGRKMADILGVPREYELVCFLPIGKAARELRPSPPKKPFSERAWFNGFGKGAQS